MRILAAVTAAKQGQIPSKALLKPSLSTSGAKKNVFTSKIAVATQACPTAVRGSTPHAREAKSVLTLAMLQPIQVIHPGVNSSSPLMSHSLIPSDGDTKHERADTRQKMAWDLRAVPNQGASFKAEYATIELKAKMLTSPALEGPMVSDSLLRREEIASAIHINILIVVETFKSYPLKRRQ